jgi:hypothetical protein
VSERGVFAVDRGIWDHDFLSSVDPFSRREAWLWLVSEAAWKPRRRRIVGRIIELERGQLVASLRFIAGKWRWSEPRVRRFLVTLVTELMIDAKTDAGVSVITISKYDEYQRVSLPIDAMTKTPLDAGATQERRKVEDIEYNKLPEANASGPTQAELESDLFKRGRQVCGKSSGGLLSALLKAKQFDVALARAVIETASTKNDPREFVAAATRVRDSPAPRPGSREDRAERTYRAQQELKAFANGDHADDAQPSGGAGRPDAGLLPFGKSARS